MAGARPWEVTIGWQRLRSERVSPDQSGLRRWRSAIAVPRGKICRFVAPGDAADDTSNLFGNRR